MPTIVHWFRRDLRLADNTALFAAARDAGDGRVIPFYCWDRNVLEAEHVGPSARRFLEESLRNLATNLEADGSRLIVRNGSTVPELARITRETGAIAVYWNRGYEPFARELDTRIEELGRQQGFANRSFKDSVFHEVDDLRSGNGTVYTIFTPYARKWRSLPKALVLSRFRRMDSKLKRIPSEKVPPAGSRAATAFARGGEAAANELLGTFLKRGLPIYEESRDYPLLDATSHLSAHLRHGTISERTVYWAAVRSKETLPSRLAASAEVFITELIWREFFMQVLAQFPFVAKGCFRPQYDRLRWRNDDCEFQAWCSGRTGYPIVDAAMRQLNATGWMHNRLRMIVAMFLVKDLQVDWRWGERYFMTKLVDGDVAANNGGWQWSAGTGTDAAPYFRIFSPVEQSRRFDPDGSFIRKWVPELRRLGAREIHAPWLQTTLPLTRLGHPAPIVDHAARRRETLTMFQRGRSLDRPIR